MMVYSSLQAEFMVTKYDDQYETIHTVFRQLFCELSFLMM